MFFLTEKFCDHSVRMFEEFQNIDVFRPSIFDIGGNMLVALICGLIIALVYRLTYKGPNYSSTFVNSLVLLCMITAVVILVIGNNLARAFGLVGAMSIIRFRTAVRDTQDIIFIFFSLAIGMAAGVGLVEVAIIATLIISSVIIVLVFFRFGEGRRKRHLLQISYTDESDVENDIARILKKHCRRAQLINLKNLGYNGSIEAFYQVHLKSSKRSPNLVRDLTELEHTKNINLYFDEADANAPT